MLPTARLWPIEWTRWTLSDWHRQTTRNLRLDVSFPLHCARDHWAVRALCAGTPVALVQNQLGPSREDRSEWERRAREVHERRIIAK
jgi:hypothetical protein